MSKYLVVSVLVVSGLGATAWGENNPFIGTWKLNLARSKFDPGPPLRSRTVTVVAAGDGMKITVDTVDANGNRTSVVEMPKLDGKDYARAGASEADPDTIAFKRIDAYTLEETLKKDGKIVAIIRQVISKDGKTRTAARVKASNARGQAVHDVLVFDRQ